MNSPLRAFALGCCVALWALATQAAGTLPNWDDVAAVDTIQVITTNDDDAHTRRETTVWLAVHEDQGYIRTGGTTWGANVERDSNLGVVIEGVAYELRVEPIPAGALYEAVTKVFRDKYGFSDAVIGLFRGIGGPPTIMRLEGRVGIPMGN